MILHRGMSPRYICHRFGETIFNKYQIRSNIFENLNIQEFHRFILIRELFLQNSIEKL